MIIDHVSATYDLKMLEMLKMFSHHWTNYLMGYPNTFDVVSHRITTQPIGNYSMRYLLFPLLTFTNFHVPRMQNFTVLSAGVCGDGDVNVIPIFIRGISKMETSITEGNVWLSYGL